MGLLNFRGFCGAVLVAGLMASVGCSKGGFSILGSGNGGSGNSGSNNGAGSSGSGDANYDNLQYKGVLAGGPNDKTLVVDIDKANGALILVLPLQLNSFVEKVEGPVPALPGAKFETYKDSQGKSYFAVSVPLRYVLKGASFLPPDRLPNGNPLPQIPSGELPSVAVSVPGKNNVKFHLYLGVNVVGVLITSPFDPFVALEFPIRNGIRTIGYFDSVPAVASSPGGFFLATTLPTEVAAVIDDHFRF